MKIPSEDEFYGAARLQIRDERGRWTRSNDPISALERLRNDRVRELDTMFQEWCYAHEVGCGRRLSWDDTRIEQCRRRYFHLLSRIRDEYLEELEKLALTATGGHPTVGFH
jgi:hypothetical protein